MPTDISNSFSVPEEGCRNSPRLLISAFAGLFLICIAAFTFNLTAQCAMLWLTRADYIRTELEIESLSYVTGEALLVGRIMATGEEVHNYHVPHELYVPRPSGSGFELMKAEEAKGKRVPIWYAAEHDSLFTSAKIQYRSEYPKLPTFQNVFNVAAVNFAIFLFGVILTRRSFKAAMATVSEEKD